MNKEHDRRCNRLWYITHVYSRFNKRVHCDDIKIKCKIKPWVVWSNFKGWLDQKQTNNLVWSNHSLSTHFLKLSQKLSKISLSANDNHRGNCKNIIVTCILYILGELYCQKPLLVLVALLNFPSLD